MVDVNTKKDPQGPEKGQVGMFDPYIWISAIQTWKAVSDTANRKARAANRTVVKMNLVDAINLAGPGADIDLADLADALATGRCILPELVMQIVSQHFIKNLGYSEEAFGQIEHLVRSAPGLRVAKEITWESTEKEAHVEVLDVWKRKCPQYLADIGRKADLYDLPDTGADFNTAPRIAAAVKTVADIMGKHNMAVVYYTKDDGLAKALPVYTHVPAVQYIVEEAGMEAYWTYDVPVAEMLKLRQDEQKKRNKSHT